MLPFLEQRSNINNFRNMTNSDGLSSNDNWRVTLPLVRKKQLFLKKMGKQQSWLIFQGSRTLYCSDGGGGGGSTSTTTEMSTTTSSEESTTTSSGEQVPE